MMSQDRMAIWAWLSPVIAWVILGLIGYMLYRRRNHAPVLGSIKRDWVKLHEHTLTSAGELEMLDEYREAVADERREGTG